MKKLLYILALLLVTSVSLLSCTEEVIKPQTNGTAGVGIKE